MVSSSVVVALIFGCCVVLHAAARPTEKDEFRELHINYDGGFSNHITACNVSVTVNHDPDRIPATIRIVKCIDQPDCQHCRKIDVNGHQFSCVQIVSNIEVLYTNKNEVGRLESVEVDCQCMVHPGQQAEIITPELS